MSSIDHITELKLRTIKTEIRDKVRSRLDLIGIVDVADFKGGLIVAGGCFASMLRDERPRDFDFFILDNMSSVMLAGKVNSAGQMMGQYSTGAEAKGYEDFVKLQNPNIHEVYTNTMNKTQWILTKYKTRKELVEHFDMLHCTVSYDVSEDKIYFTKKAVDAILNKKIVRNGDHPIKEWRLKKMLGRGWTE